MNKWKNIGKSILQGEEILSAIWFHSGVQVNTFFNIIGFNTVAILFIFCVDIPSQ